MDDNLISKGAKSALDAIQNGAETIGGQQAGEPPIKPNEGIWKFWPWTKAKRQYQIALEKYYNSQKNHVEKYKHQQATVINNISNVLIFVLFIVMLLIPIIQETTTFMNNWVIVSTKKHGMIGLGSRLDAYITYSWADHIILAILPHTSKGINLGIKKLGKTGRIVSYIIGFIPILLGLYWVIKYQSRINVHRKTCQLCINTSTIMNKHNDDILQTYKQNKKERKEEKLQLKQIKKEAKEKEIID